MTDTKPRKYRVSVNTIPTVTLTAPFGSKYEVYWAGHFIGWVWKSCETSGSATRWAYRVPGGATVDYHDTRGFALQCLLRAVEEKTE
jgi:hypothetical protein